MQKDYVSGRVGNYSKVPHSNKPTKDKPTSEPIKPEVNKDLMIKNSNSNNKLYEDNDQLNNHNNNANDNQLQPLPELNSFHQSGESSSNFNINNNNIKSPSSLKETRDDLKKRLTNININLTPNESLMKNYPTLYTIIKPLRGIRPKKITLYEVKYYIEEIYSVCILKQTKTLKDRLSKGVDNPSLDLFPSFVHRFISNKYVKKAIIDQTLLNLLLSIDYFRDKDEDIDLFCKFLSEEYTDEDLLLYLFFRAAIEKELKVLFLEKAKDEIKIQHMEERDEIFTVLYINTKMLSRIVASVFASDEECIINTFIKRLEPLMEKNVNSNHYNTLTTTQLLKTAVDDFHSSRQTYPECKGIGAVPFAGSKQNEFFECNSNSNNNVLDDHDHDHGNDANSYANLINYFTNQPGDKIDNIKAVLLIYLKEKEIMIFFEKYYSGELNLGLDDSLLEIRDLVLKKLYYLIHFIFYEDELSWNSALGIEANSINDIFANLVLLKERLLSVSFISELNEPIVEAFCASLLSTPLLLNQISKIINSKRQI